MKVYNSDLEGVLIIEPTIHTDSRGAFFEAFSARDFEEQTGLKVEFVQENESFSKRGVLRGLHFQREPWAQAKLVRVIEGKVIDVAVDIRPDSRTFGKHIAIELSRENHRQLYIPKGFAHGFIALEDSIFQYKCDEYYHPESEGCIIWNDPHLAIDWGVKEDEIILSDKDKRGSLLREIITTK